MNPVLCFSRQVMDNILAELAFCNAIANEVQIYVRDYPHQMIVGTWRNKHFKNMTFFTFVLGMFINGIFWSVSSSAQVIGR